MDFFQHQDRAKSNSFKLIALFVMAVAGVILALYAIFVGIGHYLHHQNEMPFDPGLWHPELFLAVTLCTLAVISLGSLYKILTIGSSGDVVARSLGGRQVPSNTTDLSERVLLNVVEEMAIAAGTPVPPVYVLDQEEGINAFAAGTSPQNAVIGVTRGTLATMKREELQGIIAHEFSHILNGDMRLNLRLLGWLHGILVIAMIGWTILRYLPHTSSSRSNSKEKGGLALVMLVLGIAFLVVGSIGVFFARLIKSAISRQREFLADASAVQFTRNPQGIGNALKKIGGWKSNSHVAAPQSEEISHMFFGSSGFSLLFATHPPLLQRVQRIDPQFNGSFPNTFTIEHSTNELLELAPALAPNSTHSPSHDGFHESAIEGAESLSQNPTQLSASIGAWNPSHVQHAHNIYQALSPELVQEARNPLGSVAIIYGLLLSPTSSPHRQKQIAILNDPGNRSAILELKRLLPRIEQLPPEQKLPLVCLTLPALNELSPKQVDYFYQIVNQLIAIDHHTSLFEYALHRFIAKRLLPRLHQDAEPRGNVAWSSLTVPFQVVLSTLAYASGDHPQHAFQAGLTTLPPKSFSGSLLDHSQCTWSQLDHALDRLHLATPAWKRKMIDSFSACVVADQHCTIEEAELLRVIADALGCPTPPVLEGPPLEP